MVTRAFLLITNTVSEVPEILWWHILCLSGACHFIVLSLSSLLRSSNFFLGTINFRSDGLLLYEKSKQHIQCTLAPEAAVRESQNDVPAVIRSWNQMDEKLNQGMIRLFHIAYYLAWKERPMSDFPHEIGLHSRIGGELPNCYSSDKACAR